MTLVRFMLALLWLVLLITPLYFLFAALNGDWVPSHWGENVRFLFGLLFVICMGLAGSLEVNTDRD